MKVTDAANFPTEHFKHRFKVKDTTTHYKILWDYYSKVDCFLCIDCEMLSYNSHDLEQRYCGICHEFKDDLDE